MFHLFCYYCHRISISAQAALRMFRSFSGTIAVIGFAYVIVSLPRSGLVVTAPRLANRGIRSDVYKTAMSDVCPCAVLALEPDLRPLAVPTFFTL